MRKVLIVCIFIVLIIPSLQARELLKYELQIPETFIVEEYKGDLKKWRLSLFKGLGYKENKVTEAVFLKTDVPIEIDDRVVLGKVYRNKSIANQFYISASNTIIDFNLMKVGTMGVAGITQHPTPSGRMVIILAPQFNTELLGVTLGFSGKVQVSPPVFSKNKVSYVWYSW